MKYLALIFLASVVSAYHKYIDMTSDEIDSEEHGVYPGDRATSCKCGWANKAISRIVGGQETGINQFPWITAIIYKKQLVCGGTIISDHHVLTAAHCTLNRTANNMFIIVGGHDYARIDTDSRKIMGIKSIKIHNNYDPDFFFNDISLLETKEKIIFSNKVGPACLPSSRNEFDMVDKYIKVVGWGLTKFNGKLSRKLLHANLRVIPLTICKEEFVKITGYDEVINTENPTQFCTYSKAKDACQGDSGGPVVFLDPETNMYTLVGVVSYSSGSCATEIPAVQTEVAAYLDWILENIQSTNPEDKTCAKI